MKKTVISGIQPTGNVHLGNYLGSIRNWVGLQDEFRCFFGIMNLHAITLPQDPKALRQNVLDAATIYIACGIDAEKSVLFAQSEVAAHAELAWVLGCLTPMGWLNRMTQFKDKSQSDISVEKARILKKLQGEFSESELNSGDLLERVLEFVLKAKEDGSNKQKSGLGLYSYPVLMAADILAYQGDFVPVGQDQKQHLELTRDLAGAFNRKVGRDYFNLPEPLIIKNVQRIMSLQDGRKKMSKSDEVEISRINLLDDDKTIEKKIKKAKTDSEAEISYDENRPEIYNLLNIFAVFSEKSAQEIAKDYQNSGYGRFKADLAEILVENLRDIKYNISVLRKDVGFVEKILEDGKEKASEIAEKTKREVFSLMGL